jgi:Carboxypeptidase regulatory-like domain
MPARLLPPLLLAGTLLFGQATSVVQISGVVTDSNGGLIPKARVKTVQTDTGQEHTTSTEADGSYTLPNLPIGPYRLEAAADGFRTYVQTGIVLQVNTNPIINVTLQLGNLSQQVEVKADATMVETQTNGISQVIDQRRVVDLPLNGRQPTQLILLSGAAVTAPASDMASSKNYPSSVTISVAGGQANGTYYLLDGGDHNDAFGAINLPLPFPDALQEFSVQTNAIPASYGVRAGAVVNLVTKSGTNELHGDLFHFLRTGVTNARPFFAPRRDNLKRNQFGATAGDAIVRNRLFVFGGYQGTRLHTAPPTSTVFVPTQAVLGGDFSTFASAACGKSRALMDPSTGAPFPGNMIPTSRFVPQAVSFLKYVPVATDPCGKLLFGVPNNSSEDQFLGRGDWIHNAKHSVIGRYYFADWRNPGAYDGKNLLLTTRPGVLDRAQSVTLGDTYTMSAGKINAFHFTWSRDRVTRGPASGLPTSADIGLNVAPSPGNFPQFILSNEFSTFCGTCSLAHVNTTSLQFADDFSLIWGRHQFSFGGEFIRRTLDFQVSTQQNPEFDFNGQFTNDPIGDLLLGRTNQFIQGNLTKVDELANYVALYFHDKIRINSRLSLNAGLRWEPYLPAYDVKNRSTHFDLKAFLAGTRTGQFTNAPPGLFFPGDPGMPAGATNRHMADFAPRVGLVWDPGGNGRTTIRSAYGILYDVPPMQYFDRFGFGPPWASTITIVSPAGGLANPFQGYPGGNPFPQPSPPPANAVFVQAGQFVNLPLYIKPTYMQQWNLSVQQQAGDAWLFTVNYLGNKSTHRWINRAINPAVFIPGLCGSQACSTTGNTNARRILSLANPTAGALYGPMAELDDGANGSYNGLLLSANHRFSSNFSMLLNYTWSHCISDGDAASEIGGGYQNPNLRAAERGNCVVDIRQIFNASMVAVSPRMGGRWTRRVLGDWEVSSILSKRTGFWFNTTSGRDNSLTGINADRPDVIADSHLSEPSLAAWFNTAAFRSNATATFGNSGRNNLEGPGGFTLDAAVMRKFAITERHGLQLRAEAFNVLNHPVFSNPRTSLTDSNLGRILGANDPRIMQFALKYVF